MKWAALLLACTLLACGWRPKQTFVPPDGQWWSTSSQSERDGFFVGWFACHDSVLRQSSPVAIANVQVEEKITGYYRSHGGDLHLPVTAVLARLYSAWRRTGAYKFSPAVPGGEWDGDYWRQAVEGERPGLVLGFLSCQVAAGESVTTAQVDTLVSWIDHFYGIDPNDPGVIGPRGNETLSTAVLAAERANP